MRHYRDGRSFELYAAATGQIAPWTVQHRQVGIKVIIGNYTIKMKAEVPEVVLEYLRTYYTELLADYPDVLTTQVVSKITGYGTTTINSWCNKGYIEKQHQPYSESISGGVFLFDSFSHHHPKIIVAYPYLAILCELEESLRSAGDR